MSMRRGVRNRLNGDRWDAFHPRSRWPIAWACGEAAAIKRAYSQRTRHAARAIAVMLITISMMTGMAHARSCEDDAIQSKSDDGSILVMMSGAVYRVLPGDDIDSMLWLPADQVLICDAPFAYNGRTLMLYDIINTDEGEKVGAERLR